MKFLLDQDVYALTEHFLRDEGHDIVTASELGLSRAKDEQLLRKAGEQDRILLTRDRDYGNLVFVKKIGKGVIYLRGTPSEMPDIHAELEKVLGKYSAEKLAGSFVVIEKKRHRVRKVSP